MFRSYKPDFIEITLDDNCKYVEADVLGNRSLVKSNCYKVELIIFLHSVVNNNLKASLLELIKYNA